MAGNDYITVEDGRLLCKGCGFNHMHPVDAHHSTANDGDPPYQWIRVKQVGKDLLIMDKDTIFAEHGGNRKRELDTSLRFWCEGCHKVSQVEFLFHKGTVLIEHVMVGDYNVDTGEISPLTADPQK